MAIKDGQLNDHQREVIEAHGGLDGLLQQIDDRIQWFYKNIDGTIELPSSREGDLLEMVKTYIDGKKEG